jgi:hypothetical protein
MMPLVTKDAKPTAAPLPLLVLMVKRDETEF